MSDAVAVGVAPRAAYAERAHLFRALSRVFPVRFEPRDEGAWTGLAAAIVFADEGDASSPAAPESVPCLVLPARAGSDASGAETVTLAADETVDRSLRGRRLEDAEAGAEPLRLRPGDTVLASARTGPLWAARAGKRSELRLSALPVPELAEGESIRDRLKPRRFASLLPLADFLLGLASSSGWARPPLRASVIIDDPNLHLPSYGYVRFGPLAEHAARHGYHVAMATVPLDLWYFSRAAARIFAENEARLSLLVHGNDHVRSELARALSPDDARALLRQALARVERFERRSGLRVDRVMVPPHGDCSETMLAALAATGFDAISWWPKLRSDVSGWEVADFAPAGLPSIPRTLLRRWDDLPFRAYLRQPVVLEGHHTDLAEGLGVLEEAAQRVSDLGDHVVWASLGRLAETNVAVRREGPVLRARIFSRRVVLDVPEGVERLVVEAPAYEGSDGDAVVTAGTGSASGGLGAELPVSPGRVQLRLVRPDAGGGSGSASRGSPWALPRRLLTEARDRALPAWDRTARSRVRR